MEEDFMKADEDVCLLTSDDELFDHNKHHNEGDKHDQTCLDITAKKINCDINGHHQTDGNKHDEVDGEKHRESIDIEGEDSTLGNKHKKVQADADTNGDEAESEVDGVTHGDLLEVDDNENTLGDRLECEEGDNTLDGQLEGEEDNTLGDKLEAKEDDDTHNNQLEAEDDSETHGDQFETEEDGVTLDEQFQAEEEDTRNKFEADGDDDTHGSLLKGEDYDTHDDQLEAEKDGETYGEQVESKEDDDTHVVQSEDKIDGESSEDQEDGNTYGDFMEAQADGEAEIDGDIQGDISGPDIEVNTHNDNMYPEVEDDTHSDQMKAELDVGFHCDFSDTEREANTHCDYQEHLVDNDNTHNVQLALDCEDTPDIQIEAAVDGDAKCDLSDAEMDNVAKGDGMDVNCKDDPPFSSLIFVGEDLPGEDEKDNEFPDNNISTDGSASMLEDQDEVSDQGKAKVNTSVAEEDTAVDELTSNKSDVDEVHLNTAVIKDETSTKEYKNNMDVAEINSTGQKSVKDVNETENESPDKIETGEVNLNNQKVSENENEANIPKNTSVESTLLHDQIVPSDETELERIKEEDVAVNSDVDGKKDDVKKETTPIDTFEGLKPESCSSNSKELDKNVISTKLSERKKQAESDVICLISSDEEDSENVLNKPKSESSTNNVNKAQSSLSDLSGVNNEVAPKSSDHHGNTADQGSASKDKTTKETKESNAAADEEEDIVVIEEASSAPARKPAGSKFAENNPSTVKRCKLCKKIFKSADQLRKHVREAHGLIMIDKEQILRCKICSFKGIWSVFVKHLSEKHPSSSHLIKDVDKEKIGTCSICSFRGPKAHLNKHMLEKHPGVRQISNSVMAPNSSRQGGGTSKQETVTKASYGLRPRKAPVDYSNTKGSLPKSNATAVTNKSPVLPVSSVSSTSQKVYATALKQSSTSFKHDETLFAEPVKSLSADGLKKQKAFFEKIVVDGYKMGKKQIRLDVLLENCDKTVYECAICQQSFPNYLQVYFHQKVCFPNAEKSSRIVVYLPFEKIMSQFVYKKVGMKRFLQCQHCNNKVSAQNVSAIIQALHLSVHVVPEVTIRTYFNGLVGNRIGHARQDSNKKAFSWDEVLKPVSVNRSSVVSSLNNNLDRYICTSGRLHQMESRHVLNDDLHDFGKIHSSSSDEEQWETTYRRRKHHKKKKKIEFLSPNSKQKQSLLASVRYRLTSKREHEREQRLAKRDEQKRKRDRKKDDSDSDYGMKKPASSSIQKLSFGMESNETSSFTYSEMKTSDHFPMQISASNALPKTGLASLLASPPLQAEYVTAQIPSPSEIHLQDELSPDDVQTNDNFFPELEVYNEDEPKCVVPENNCDDKTDCLPENDAGDKSSSELPSESSLSSQIQEEPQQNPEEPEDPGPLLTEEDLAEYWRLFEEDEVTPDQNGQCDEKSVKTLVPETGTDVLKTEASPSIFSLLSGLPRENDILDYYGGSRQPVSSRSVVFMTTQQVFKYFTLMPVGNSSANFVCSLRGCTATYSASSELAAHLGSHFPMRVIIQDYPSTSVGQVVPLLTTKQVLQHYRSRQTANDERFRYSCCFKRCNASTLLDQSLSIHLAKHFTYICIGTILLRKTDFTGHPLLSHYNCLRGARYEHSNMFQLTCKNCDFFVITYIFKGKLGDVVEAEISAHTLSHNISSEAEEALRKMCRTTSNKLSSDKATLKVPFKAPSKPAPNPAPKHVTITQPRKNQPATPDVARKTVSVTEPELLKKFGATSNGWRCLVKHCGFLHRGVKDLFIFANHLRRHILGCKKIIVMKKKTPSAPNKTLQGSSTTGASDKPKPPIDVVTIDDTSDDEKKTSKVPTLGNSEKTDVKPSCNVKVVLNKLPLNVAIDKIESMKALENSDINSPAGKGASKELCAETANEGLKRKIKDDEKSVKKTCVEENEKRDEKSNSPVSGSTPTNGLNEKNNSRSKRKWDEPETPGTRKSLRLSGTVNDGLGQNSKSHTRDADEEMAGKDQLSDKINDEKSQENLSMEDLISELKSTKSDPIILSITTVERFFKQEICSNLNRSSAVVGTMNFTCLMCDKAGFKGKDFELVRHLESHIGKNISLKMKELQVKDTKDDETESTKDESTAIHRTLEDLRNCPDDRIQMRFQEVENFFDKNVRPSRTKLEFSFGVLMYTCIECNQGDLKTEHLVKHLEDHVEKTIKLIRNPAKSNGPTQS
ncbi:uncharacterized protein LOC117119007 isoform X2 [Anneissia japonica]|nr:uncharacterized protein LOC117119007 isoform X2 [Anneissia japonica]